MFGWEYPPKHLGGLGVACQGLVRGLLRLGTKVTLVLPHGEADSDDGMQVKCPTEKQLQTVRVRSAIQPYDCPASFAERNSITGTPRTGINLYGRDLGEAVWEFEELAVELTRDTEPAIVHSHDWMTFGAGKRAALHHHVPFIAQIHATELDRTHGSPNQWIYDRERRGLHAADHIVTVSQFTKNILVKEYGIRADKIDVVHNGAPHAAEMHCIHDARFANITNISTYHPMILFIGRLTVQKGPFHFLEAARLVKEHNSNARFVLAGDGYLLSELIDRSCAMGLHNDVIFAGKVNNHEARELYRHAHCFVMPSTSEPFGLVALEAIAHGAPVIVSKQSGVREVLPHSMQIDFWDIDKLADCILTVLREYPLATQLRSEAVHTLHHLTWENQAAKMLSVYHKAREKF
jgi:glycosyltransferase involved in cell wall biosynthesis